MVSFHVFYIGSLELSVPENAVEVRDDPTYVTACHSVALSLRAGAGLDLWVRYRHHFAWLKDYFRQLQIEADFSEKTARTVLEEKWGIPVPEWVSEQDILRQDLIALEVKPEAGKTFEAVLIQAVLDVDPGVGLPGERTVSLLIATLTTENWMEVRRRMPFIEEALRRLVSAWRQNAQKGWLFELCGYIPEKADLLWRLISSAALLRSYPGELLERVLPAAQVPFARSIPPGIAEHLALEPQAREEALTQVRLLLSDLGPRASSSEEFQKLVSRVSGKTEEELSLIEGVLKNAKFQPSEEDIRLVQKVFEGCGEIRKSRLEALRHTVRPQYPQLLSGDTHWDKSEWIHWTVDQYAPYRDWQIRSGCYDAPLEAAVCRFSDWYIDNYANIQADTRFSLIHALNNLTAKEKNKGLTVILVADCLPVTFFPVADHALRVSGFKRHDLSYKYAALPTVTEYNKSALISGAPVVGGKSYPELLAARSASDWGDMAVHYIVTLHQLSELIPGPAPLVVLINFTEGDEILHSDLESKNRSYEEELARSYSHLAQLLAAMCDRWQGPREEISVLLLTDHGACRILEKERRSFDSTVIAKLFDDEKHRVATMTRQQAQKVPDNLWEIGYKFSSPFIKDDVVHFLPRGHNTVRKAGQAKVFMHGGVAPEEVIVPSARYGLVASAWKRPFTRFLSLDMTPDGTTARFYIQRVVAVKIEIQNPNPTELRPVSLEILVPESVVKGVHLHNVGPQGVSVLSIDLYFQKSALAEKNLELKLRYAVGSEEYEHILVLPAEFRSAMTTGFSLKDL